MSLALISTALTTPVQRVAMTSSDCDLIDSLYTISCDLFIYMERGEPGTQAHAGMLEMIEAFGRELSDRGYVTDICSNMYGHKRDGSDLPILIYRIDGVKLQTPVLCF